MKLLKYPVCLFLSLFCGFAVIELFNRVDVTMIISSPDSPLVFVYVIGKVILLFLAFWCPWVAWGQVFNRKANLDPRAPRDFMEKKNHMKLNDSSKVVDVPMLDDDEDVKECPEIESPETNQQISCVTKWSMWLSVKKIRIQKTQITLIASLSVMVLMTWCPLKAVYRGSHPDDYDYTNINHVAFERYHGRCLLWKTDDIGSDELKETLGIEDTENGMVAAQVDAVRLAIEMLLIGISAYVMVIIFEKKTNREGGRVRKAEGEKKKSMRRTINQAQTGTE